MLIPPSIIGHGVERVDDERQPKNDDELQAVSFYNKSWVLCETYDLDRTVLIWISLYQSHTVRSKWCVHVYTEAHHVWGPARMGARNNPFSAATCE